jgi:hypothetical protein
VAQAEAAYKQISANTAVAGDASLLADAASTLHEAQVTRMEAMLLHQILSGGSNAAANCAKHIQAMAGESISEAYICPALWAKVLDIVSPLLKPSL